ncbi:MAG: hypothetical protein AABY22_15150 [Nanoarchaeota archaeon]
MREIRSIEEVPSKVDEVMRMSLVALKNKIVEVNKKYNVDYFDYAIDYLKDGQELNKKR